MTASAPHATARSLDPTAARRTRLRLVAQTEAPWLHAESARRMADRLVLIKQPPLRVLDWSGRSGGSAEVLASALPQAQMNRVLRAGESAAQGKGWWQRLLQGRRSATEIAEAAVPAASFDLVWSAMGLHWEADPLVALRQWRQALSPEGFLMFSTLGPGTLSQLRALYRDADWGPAMAPMVDMHDLGDMMVEAGLADPVMDQETLRLTWATPEALLAELRTLGGNADPARWPGLRTPRWHQRLLAALAERAGPDGRIVLDFELVYGHAFQKPDPGPRVATQTEIGLDEMRSLLRRKPGA